MSTRTLQAVRLYAEAFEDLFAQCCSNPIKNAWGQEVNTAKLNAAHAFASRVLAGQEASQPAAQQGEQLVRYCPGCGSIGAVESKYRDCCPDGNEARLIPQALAEKCRDTFRIAIGNPTAAHPSTPAAKANTALHQIIAGVEAALDAAGAPAGTLVERIGALGEDAEDARRLDWLTFNIGGKALRDIGVIWSEHGDARRAIDAARAQQEAG